MKFLQFGLGKWGKNHNRILKELNHSVDVAEIDSYPSSLKEIPRYDGVIITCSSVNHFTIALECIKNKIPVFCEKPVCVLEWQIDKLYKEWLLADNPIFMSGHQVVFLEELPSGIKHMMSLRSGAIAREEGAALALMVHDIAIAQHVTQTTKFKIIEKYGDLHNMKVSLEAYTGESIELLAQSFSPIRIRHTTLIDKAGELINLKPDNWDRFDLLLLELMEFKDAIEGKSQPHYNDMLKTKIVMETVFDILRKD